jgi:hypothetical protein
MAFTQKQQAVIYGTVHGVNTITTLSIVEDAETSAEKQALAIDIRDVFLPDFKIGCASGMQFTSIVIQRRDTPSYSPYVLPIAVVGSGNAGPTQVCILWKLDSGTQGKRGKGRLYVPGIANTVFTSNLMDGSRVTSLNAAMVRMNAKYAVGGTGPWHLGIYSRANNSQVGVTQFSFSQLASCLRSRRLGVGI